MKRLSLGIALGVFIISGHLQVLTIGLNQIYSVFPGEQVLAYYLFNKDMMFFGGVAILGSFMAWRLAIYAHRSIMTLRLHEASGGPYGAAPKRKPPTRHNMKASPLATVRAQ
jgi:hypothetical protein